MLALGFNTISWSSPHPRFLDDSGGMAVANSNSIVCAYFLKMGSLGIISEQIGRVEDNF